MAADILVVDDEADIRELVAGILSDENYNVRVAANSEAALAAIRARKPALLVLDIWMQGGGLDGLALLDLVKGLDPDLPVLMISGHANIETAVAAIKRGAYDFLEKPFKSDRLLLLVSRALEAATLKRENRRLRRQSITPEGFIGRSGAAQHLRQLVAKVGPANSRVLISGPPGSGKELVARLIHESSQRAAGEFVAIGAANLAPGRVESQLFGEEGEDGKHHKVGVFERAHGGTLYIDEVADMPRETQGKILRVLVEQRFRRVGGDQDVQVDVRVVSSTARDLATEITGGRFREDLFHRLNVVPVRVPGLAERREDIPELAEYFIERISEVTEVFEKERDFKKISRAITTDAGVADVSGYTDYGRVWSEFLAQIESELHPRATVIVLGDARTNGRPAREDLFAQVAARAGRTFWLNPEPKLYWNYGDSVINAYAEYCIAYECWTAAHLSDFVEARTRPGTPRASQR